MKISSTFSRILIILSAACLFAAAAYAGEQPATSGADGAYRTPGSIVAFGRYEQDNDPDNGPEAIEWIVLDTEGDRALLLSRYGLIAKQYNKAYAGVTWEACTLRGWLNSEFMNEAFTREEQSAILLTDVDNSAAQGYSEWDTEGGNNTRDHIFLLSCAEAEKYLGVTYDNNDNLKSRIIPTPYAVANGAWVNQKWKTEDGQNAGRWWLRSPGRHQYRAAFVYGAGSLRSTHVTSSTEHFGGNCVRPALWLDLNSVNP